MPQKGFILVFLLIILGTSGYLIYSNKLNPSQGLVEQIQDSENDPVESWQTYTDSEFGFSFKYPKEWNYSPIYFDGGGQGVGFYSDKDKKDNQLTINILKNEDFDTFSKRINLKIPEILVNNHRALRYETGVYIRLSPSRILSIYRFQYPDTSSHLNNILSTFKFLD